MAAACDSAIGNGAACDDAAVDGAAFDVAIVGYGPVGQVAAGLLGQAGLRVHVCDRRVGVYEIPRALSLDHEIMRVFQQLGVADAVAPFTEPFSNSEYYGVDGRLIRRMTMVAPPYPQAHTPSLVFTQPAVEAVLRARVAELPDVTVALGAEMRRVHPDAGGVTVELLQDGRAQTIRARWLIACDGGASPVRSQLGMALEDLDFDEPWLVADVRVNARGLARLPAVSVQYCEPERPCTLVIGPGNHRRWEISLRPGEDPQAVATPAGTWALLARWIGPEDGELWRQASYRFHALVVAQWRQGRVFLAGDAAHMQPPFLGQGMCQGIRDVANLSWKLAAVLKGEVAGAAAEALLDSYGEERKAHVRALTRRIKAVGAVICERDPGLARARDEQLLAECGGVVRDMPRQDILPRLEGGLLQAPRDAADAATGSLFPQPWLLEGGERRRMDERFGNGWRLVLAAGVAAATAAAPHAALPAGWTRIALTGLVEADGVLAAWFERHRACAALVRPDNVVFGTAASADAIADLVDDVRARLGV